MVAAAPPALSLWFTERIEPAFQSIEVRDATGARVDAGKARSDPSDARAVQIGLKPLPAGRYKVRWRVLSTDTHKAEGGFEFEVRP